ncbi:MAG: hypothetical protein M0T75_09965 [Chloroflexi bacterium]|nr:hypothetical protein [Chloroflexota bacterium]
MIAAAERDADLRLARIHLRTGACALARAELEALAGADRLDPDGILDLAEVRWRTGDPAGAAAAAAAWLEEGADVGPALALAHVIGAEAAAARGRADEAAQHVEAALAGLRDRSALDTLLAGIAARAPWPWDAEAAPGSAPPPGQGPAVAVVTPSPGTAAAPLGTPATAPQPVAAPPPSEATAETGLPGAPVGRAAAELARAGAALVEAAPDRAAVLLALALRADRAVAEAVLAALDAPGPGGGRGAPETDAALAFVRAEALRAAGRHAEARIAYASAERLALAPSTADPPGSPS